jgi:hypothetical protein
LINALLIVVVLLSAGEVVNLRWDLQVVKLIGDDYNYGEGKRKKGICVVECDG